VRLDDVLREIRARQLILLQNGALWSPNTRVPMDTRRAIREHRAMLVDLIRGGDIRVCVDPGLHRQYWQHAGSGRFVCEICAHILELREDKGA